MSHWVQKEHNISYMQSYKSLPDINSFCMDDDLQGHTYKIRVENKTNGKIPHIITYFPT